MSQVFYLLHCTMYEEGIPEKKQKYLKTFVVENTKRIFCSYTLNLL